MNKMFRYYRTHHARRGSLQSNLKDVFDRSAQTADPQILSHIQAKVFPMRKKKSLPMSIKPLLVYPNLYDFEEEPEEVIPDISDTDLSSNEDCQVGSWSDSDLAESDNADPTEYESDTSSESSVPSEMEVDDDNSDWINFFLYFN